MNTAYERIEDIKGHDAAGREITKGTRCIRTAHCERPGHGSTTAFEGVAMDGWVFRCRGKWDRGHREWIEAHMFIAQPAGEVEE